MAMMRSISSLFMRGSADASCKPDLAQEQYRASKPFAVEEQCPVVWDTGAPLPMLLQSDDKAYVLFLLPDSEEEVGLVEFESCAATKFGAPNDETLHGHPLYGSGLKYYGFMRIEHSPWVEELIGINSVHSKHSRSLFENVKHYILAFHDSTFECIAHGYSATRVKGSLVQVAAGLLPDLSGTRSWISESARAEALKKQK